MCVNMQNKTDTIIFGGGCFWCTEAIFKMLRGVVAVIPGYAGGNIKNPTYDQVCTGNTGHAEVIKIEYDPTQISLQVLLDVFFDAHDPTLLNRQGNDVGTQYRSIILYTNKQQLGIISDYINRLQIQSSKKIVTQVAELGNFYEAEDYHMNYYQNHSSEQYCTFVITPKIKKIRMKYSKLV